MHLASRHVALLTATVVATACRDAGSGAPGAAVEPADGRSAVASCVISREALYSSGGAHVYIEPENVIAVGSRVLVAGIPSYTWEVGTAPKVVMATRDAFIAALFADGDVTLVEKPVDVRVGDVRVAALDGERWAVLFSEEGPDSLFMSERLRAVWYGEHDGAGWSRVERLPPPPEGWLDFSSSSALVNTPTGVGWAVAARLPRGGESVRYFRRGRDGWTSEEAWAGSVETTALAYDPSGLVWLALVGDDPDLPGWQQSLRLYALNGVPKLVSRAWIAEEGTRIRAPYLTPLAGGMMLTWRSVGRGSSVALARTGIDLDGGGTLVRIASKAIQVEPLSTDVPSWVVHHLSPITQVEELRLVQAPDGTPSTTTSTLNPYRGFFAAMATTPGEVLVVGPEFDPDPARPTVRSLLLRLSTSCT